MKHIIPKFRTPRVSTVVMRLIAALLVLIMMGAALTACGGQTTTQLTLNSQTIVSKKEYSVSGEHRNNMVSSIDTFECQVSDLTESIGAYRLMKPEDKITADNIRALLKDALRGYDVSAADFDAANLPTPIPEKATEYAYNVLVKHGLANAEAFEKMRTDDLKYLIYGGDVSEEKLNDLVEVIAGYKCKVSDLEGNIGAYNQMIKQGELKESSTITGDYIREQLVAALRGYDMTAADFDDDNLPAANPDKATEYAYNVLSKHNVEDAVLYSKMSIDDLQAVVDSFKSPVTVEADMGFFTLIQHWVALGFEWLINVPGFGSFILGTVYFAIVVEILMLPLGIYQQKNSRKQALLRPKEMAIRKKYAGRNDQATQQKASQEVAEMYQKEGFSPMAGCLPLLLTLPVIIALYNIVINPLKYMMGASDELIAAMTSFAKASKAAGGLGLDLSTGSGTIELLSVIRNQGLIDTVMEKLPTFEFIKIADGSVEAFAEGLRPMLDRIPDFTIFKVNFGLTPGFDNPWLLFIPVVTFFLYFFSTKLNRKLSFQPTANDPQNGCSNNTMNIVMPGMSAAFTFIVPGAVGLYWGFKSIIGMVKQVIISKVMPLPEFTEADFKAAEKELAAKEKNRPVKKSGTKNPNIRSLHHIDDEDELEPLPQLKNKGDYVEDDEPEPQTANGAYLGEATLKEDAPVHKKKEKKAKKKKSAEDTPADTAAEYVADETDENNG